MTDEKLTSSSCASEGEEISVCEKGDVELECLAHGAEVLLPTTPGYGMSSFFVCVCVTQIFYTYNSNYCNGFFFFVNAKPSVHQTA
jgi:hypothetical protein